MSNGNGNTPAPELTPTPAAEWRKPREEGITVTLPYSGNVAVLRPVDLSSFLQSGEIPDILTSVAYGSLFEEQDIQAILGNPELLKNWDKLLRMIVPAAFLVPKVALDGKEPTADEITLADIDYYDRLFVFNQATAGATALYSFRGEQGADVQAVSDGKGNGNKAKSASRAKT